MVLTKKHFIAIAKILARYNLSDDLISDFCDYFKSENCLFDRYTLIDYISLTKAEQVVKEV